MTTKDYRESIDYNALAAEMMDWCLEIFDEVQHEYIYSKGPNNYIFTQEWNPLQDRNQAYMVLKRAEELGLAEKVASQIYNLPASPYLWDCGEGIMMDVLFYYLTCPTDIIVKACVDVWEKWRAENDTP